jgi:catechol 2,3-dioxygenase
MNIDTAQPALRTSEHKPQPAYRPRRLGHVNLFVSDFEQSRDFFTRVCGFEQTGIEPAMGSGFFSNGNTHHDIGFIQCSSYRTIRARFPDPNDLPGRGVMPGLNHFGWEMAHEADLVNAYQRALAAGLKPRITDNGTAYSNYLFDGDGTQHQFYADNERDWRKQYTGGVVDLHRSPGWKPGARSPSTQAMYDEKPRIRRVAEAPLHPQRVTHAVMMSPTFDASLAFYIDVGGFRVVHRTPDGACAYLAGGASHYDIVLCAAERPGMHHAAFEMAPDEDVAESLKRLESVGVEVVRDLDMPHKRAVTIRHPDGILLEFYIRRGGGFAATDAARGEERLFVA